MKNKIFFLLLSVLSLSSLFAQQTLKIEGAAKMTMTGNVRVNVIGGVNVNAAAGALNVNGGTLALDGSSVLANSGAITNNSTIVNAGSNTGTGTYKGTGGVYNGSLFVNASGGTVAPGASPGCLNFSNGYTNTGTLQIEVNGTATACTDYDKINVTGTATLGGTLQVSIGYVPVPGDQVTIVDATALSGTFATVTGLPANWVVLYDYPSTGKVTLVFAACPMVTLDPVSQSICAGSPVTFTATASGAPTPSVQWQVSINGGGSFSNIPGEMSTSLTFNTALSDNGRQYHAVFTNACGMATSNAATLTVNPTENPAFAYAKSAYCQAGADPAPVIYGTPGGLFSAPAQVSINPSSGVVDVSASTVGGPYTITYNTNGPCAQSATFALSVIACQPGATLTDALIIDNGPLGQAQPGDRIQLTAKITNAQAADYENVQLVLNNDPRVTFVPASFKSTPVAVDDAYTATVNTLLTVVVGNGLLTNDFDDNLPGLTVVAFSASSAQGGTVLVNTDGSFTYNPPASFTGNDTFTYTIRDADLQINTGTVRVRVQ